VLDPADLRSFRSIARHGNLTVAARVLRVGQPALSSVVQRLESELGVTLLLRGHDGVVLTACGQRLVEHAEAIVPLLEESAVSVDVESPCVVGCNPVLGQYFLPRVLKRLADRGDRRPLRLVAKGSSAVRDDVLAGRLDLGFVVNPLGHEALRMTPLFRDAVDFFVTEGAALDREAPLADAWAQLRSRPLIFAGPVEQSATMLTMLAENGGTPARLLPCRDLALVRALVARGVGAGLLPRRAAAMAGLARLHDKLPFVADVIQLVQRRDRAFDEGILAAIREAAVELA
jgi:DNA-binding transcriptional LysR family regulator